MDNAFYNLGAALFYAIPIALAIFCLSKIRKNLQEIKKFKGKNNKK